MYKKGRCIYIYTCVYIYIGARIYIYICRYAMYPYYLRRPLVVLQDLNFLGCYGLYNVEVTSLTCRRGSEVSQEEGVVSMALQASLVMREVWSPFEAFGYLFSWKRRLYVQQRQSTICNKLASVWIATCIYELVSRQNGREASCGRPEGRGEGVSIASFSCRHSTDPETTLS